MLQYLPAMESDAIIGDGTIHQTELISNFLSSIVLLLHSDFHKFTLYFVEMLHFYQLLRAI
jgi:hypothetical protein